MYLIAKSSFASSIADIVFSSNFWELEHPAPSIFTLASIGGFFVFSSSTNRLYEGAHPHPFPKKRSFRFIVFSLKLLIIYT